MKQRLINIALFLIFFAGLALLLYPSVSNWWNSLVQTRSVAQYTESAGQIDNEEYDALLAAAMEYNEALSKRGSDRFFMTDEEREEYHSLLDVSGTGMMGYIEIPVIGQTLPVYHGTSNTVLASGVGHFEGSSLPVGGEGSHCVLSGHRGLPKAKLFTDLDRLSLGDVFMLRTLDETFTYEVDRITIVEPDEADGLAIVAGEDLCTLITCTPYGINTQRLLVRGHRIDNLVPERKVRVTSDALEIDPVIVAPFAAVPMLLVLLVVLLITTRKKKR